MILVAANMREAEHYRDDLMAEIHPAGGRRSAIELVTPQNAHRRLRGLRPETEVYVMSCTWRNYSRAHEQLNAALHLFEVKGGTTTRRPCGRRRG